MKKKRVNVNELFWYVSGGGETWVTRKGELLKVSEMETGHIRNSIRLILRRNKWRRQQNMLGVLLFELYAKREMG